MINRQTTVDVEELRNIAKRVQDKKRDKILAEHINKKTEAKNLARRIVKKIPQQLIDAAKKGEQSIKVFQHYGSDYDRLTAMEIIDFCQYNNLGYEYFLSKDERGYVCDLLYVDFRKKN